MSGKETTLSRRHIEGLIANGHSIIIVNQRVLKVDAWIRYHPGGQKPIQHLVGKDATDEVTMMHSKETVQKMYGFQVGRIEGSWKCFVPPFHGGHFRPLEVHESAEEHESDISRPPSPTFDTESTELRESSSIASSVLSIIPEYHDGPSFLDSQTKMELNLDLSKYPALDIKTQREIIVKFRQLDQRIKERGLYDCHYSAYLWEVSRVTFLFLVMLFFWQHGWYATSGAVMGMFWSQLVFMAHDSGHCAITHNYTIDTIIGMIIAAPIGGLSLGWWKMSHNVHHIATNSPEHDPDNQHLPFLAVNQRFLGNLFSTYHQRIMKYDKVAQFLVPYQKYIYYPLLTLGRFNLYLQSYIFLVLGLGPRHGQAWWHRYFEIVGNVIFWVWFGWGIVGHIPTHLGRFNFVMVSHCITVLLHVQFTVSHFAMSTADLGPQESFPQRMLRTTMDVDCPEWLDFLHGGLQFQTIHHMFPRVPRHNLRKVQRLVLEFCKEVHIPYALYGFVRGNQEVLGRLAEVSRQAAILAECQRVVAMKGDYLQDL